MKSNIMMPQEEIKKTERQVKLLKQGKTIIKKVILENLQDLFKDTKKY